MDHDLLSRPVAQLLAELHRQLCIMDEIREMHDLESFASLRFA
jgi:hypothetical protein